MSVEMTSGTNAPAYPVFGPDDVQQREQVILGSDQRIPPLDRNSVAEAAIESTIALRTAAFGSCGPVTIDVVPEIVVTLLHHRELWESVSMLSIQLLANGTLLPRDRELTILRTAWLCQSPYPWGEHVIQGKLVGLTEADVERITVGSVAPEWSDADRALLCAVEELHGNAMISDATWTALAQRLDDQQLFELTVLIGQFTTVAYFQNALRIRLAPTNVGLNAR